MFPYNDDNVVFTGISGMIYITCLKINDSVLAFFLARNDMRLFVLAMPRF